MSGPVLDEVFTVLIHDLKSPLNGIIVGASALLRRMEKRGAEGGELAYVEALKDSAGRMDRLLRDLVDLARLQQRAMKLAVEEAPAAELCAEAASRLKQRCEAAGVRMEVSAEPALLVRTDRALVVRALEHLLDNAVRYGRPGGRVRLEARSSGAYLELSVSDDGPGPPAEELPVLFDLRHNVLRPGRSGNGLGLALVRAAAEALGGEVGASAGQAGGLSVRLSVPLSPPRAE